jgi:DNA polymerase type B, organellar and viral
VNNTVNLTVNDPIRHHDYKGSRPLRRMPKEWDSKEFIAWDGEGIAVKPAQQATEFIGTWAKTYFDIHGEWPEHYGELYDIEVPTAQPYVLLANSYGDQLIRREGLKTIDCFEFLLQTKRTIPNSIFVGFGFNYDIAQMLADLPIKRLEEIYRTNRTRFGHYRIQWWPRRWLTVSNKLTKETVTVYDVFGFFQTSFLLACEKYLGKNDPRLILIKEGKEARDQFSWEELEEFIIPYNQTELEMLVEMMNILRHDFHEVGLDLDKWYGPGAVANQLFTKHHLKDMMAEDLPWEILNASQYGYAGGRFEQFYLGLYQGRIYEYDIRSAYAAAVAKLPTLSRGYWEFAETFEPNSFGIWFINYHSESNHNRPQPLFCRKKDGRISFPNEVQGWYWTPEACLVPEFIECGYIWRNESNSKAFPFIEGIYDQRREYITQGLSSERALKTILACIYGKLAQVVGDGKPKWHQLEWAGWITSYTRAAIYKAILLNPGAIIAAETDAVFSTSPLSLEVGTGLGQWELKEFKSIAYLQSGFYYAVTDDDKIVCKYRGMDRDRTTGQPVGLPYRTVLDHLSNSRAYKHGKTPSLHSSTTRFVNIGLALNTSAVFRSWETKDKKIFLDQNPKYAKRYHLNCEKCQEGYSLADCLHPLSIGGYSGFSHPHPLPWVVGEQDENYENNLLQENLDRWQ